MKVIDHEAAGWFLVMDGTRLLLDVNCSHGAVSYSFLMELNNAETQAYTSQGHEFITRLAGKIQDSSPGVRGNSSPYGDRSATRIDRQQVDEVTIAWIKERRNAL